MGSTYEENDETITHQIVDRDNIEKKYLNRHYIQPQWIFDCINNRKLLPVEDYFIGVELPPHLSPFVEEKEGEYVPPEKEALRATGSLKIKENLNEDSQEEDSTDDDDEDEQQNEEKDSSESESENNQDLSMNDLEVDESDDESEEEEKIEVAKTKVNKKQQQNKKVIESKEVNMKVRTGKVEKVDERSQKAQKDLEERRLAEMMIQRKNKRLYHKIKRFNQHKEKEAENLRSKRKLINKQNKSNKKRSTKQN